MRHCLPHARRTRIVVSTVGDSNPRLPACKSDRELVSHCLPLTLITIESRVSGLHQPPVISAYFTHFLARVPAIFTAKNYPSFENPDNEQW
jgi:hypothetical protein